MYNYVSDNDIVLASKILPKIFDLDYKIYVETIIKDIKHINYTIISIFTFQSIVFITICAKKFTKKLNKTNF